MNNNRKQTNNLIIILIIQILLVTFNVSYLYELHSIKEFSESEAEEVENYFIELYLLDNNLTLKNCKLINEDNNKIECDVQNIFYWFNINKSEKTIKNLENDNISELKKDFNHINIFSLNKSKISKSWNITNMTCKIRDNKGEYLIKQSGSKFEVYNISNETQKFNFSYRYFFEFNITLEDVASEHDSHLDMDFYKIFISNISGLLYREVYNSSDSRFNRSVMANIPGKILDIGNKENSCSFEISRGHCKKIEESVVCALKIMSNGSINGNFNENEGKIRIDNKNCTHFKINFEIEGNMIYKYQSFDMKYNGSVNVSSKKITNSEDNLDNFEKKIIYEFNASSLNSRVNSSVTNWKIVGNEAQHNTKLSASKNTCSNFLKNLSTQFDIKGYEHKDLWFHWTLFFLTILSFAATLLKLKKYQASEKNINPDLVGFIFSIIADFHYVPAMFILITSSSLVIGEIKLLVVGALLANFMSLIIISYELIIKKKE